jgi:hypothetical protein
MLSKFRGIAGFVTPTTIDGTIENVNPITAQAALDLTAASFNFKIPAASKANHPTIYGNGIGGDSYPRSLFCWSSCIY